MRSHPVVLSATLLAALIAIAGCGADEPTGPGTGALWVTTSPGGDPDGYTVRVDDGDEQPVGPGASIQFDGLAAGDHRVSLGGVVEYCAVTGDNPRTLSITAGATVQALFQVTCSSLLGSLEITTVMSGESLDPDGFGFSLDGWLLNTPAGATRATVPALMPGEHTITLSNIAPSCTPVDGTTRTVTVPPRGSAVVEFALTCSHTPWLQVSADLETHTCAVTTDHRAYCWGNGYLGNDQPRSQSLIPLAVSGGLQFRQISAGYQYTCGVTLEDRAYCWGINFQGTLGDGSRTDRLAPVLVGNGRLFRHVSAGADHSCALGQDNLVYCWGDNFSGELGNGTRTSSLSPVPVAGGRLYRQVSAGWGFTCAIATTGQAWCWGSNTDGRLGSDSTKVISLVPVAVAGTRTYRNVSSGWDHACAVATNNEAFCWGSGWAGQIGDGYNSARWTPTLVAGGLSFDRIEAGIQHTCAESTTNLAYCWGYNFHGGVGDGTEDRRHEPVPVTGGHRFTQVTAGNSVSCGVTPERTAYCWGWNVGGQLGDGTQANRSSPVRVLEPR